MSQFSLYSLSIKFYEERHFVFRLTFSPFSSVFFPLPYFVYVCYVMGGVTGNIYFRIFQHDALFQETSNNRYHLIVKSNTPSRKRYWTHAYIVMSYHEAWVSSNFRGMMDCHPQTRIIPGLDVNNGLSNLPILVTNLTNVVCGKALLTGPTVFIYDLS